MNSYYRFSRLANRFRSVAITRFGTSYLECPDVRKNVVFSSTSKCLRPEITGFIIHRQGLCSQVNRNIDLTFSDLESLIKSGDVQLIDVREPKELVEYGTYPAAVNIPIGDLQNALKLPDDKFAKKYGAKKPQTKDSNIVFCCLKGIRSRKAIDAVAELGYKNTRHYKGGWEEYSAAKGLPLKQNPSS